MYTCTCTYILYIYMYMYIHCTCLYMCVFCFKCVYITCSSSSLSFPGADDNSLFQKFNRQHKSHPHYHTPQLRHRNPVFTIVHYASDVSYSVQVFFCVYMYMYVEIRVYSTLAKLVIEEEKKEKRGPIHLTRTVQTHKHNIHVHVTTWVPSLENWDGVFL